MTSLSQTAELSTVYTKNGGYITWVFSGLGKFWGFMNAGNSVCSNWVDLPTYPVLYAEYVGGLFHLNFWGKLAIKLTSLVLVVVLNIVGMEAVSISSIVLVAVMLTPFFVQPFIEAPAVADWGTASDSMDWAAWTGVMLVRLMLPTRPLHVCCVSSPSPLFSLQYNYQGWDSLGTIAGEVKNARRSYPLGVGIALVLATVNYAVPVMAGAGADAAVWADGGLPQIAQDIAPWLGAWVLVGASLAVLGEFNAVMGTSSRALQKMAEYGLVPSALGANATRFKTPVPAIVLQAVLCALLMNFSFAQLVVLDTAFNNMSLVLEVAAFLRLKHLHPGLPRPYAVPGYLRGAWICSFPKFGVILFSVYTLGFSWQLGVVVGVNALLAVGGAWWAYRYKANEDVLDDDDPVKMFLQGRPPSNSNVDHEDAGDVEVVPMLDAAFSPLSPAALEAITAEP